MTARFSRRILSLLFSLFAALLPQRLLAGVGGWTTNGPNSGGVQAFAAVPSEPSTVYLASDRRLYRSQDDGAHWAPAGLEGSFNLLLTSSTPSVVYAMNVGDSRGTPFLRTIYRTTDGGATWLDRRGPFGLSRAAAVDRNDPMVVYATTDVGVFRTADGGDSWQELAKLPGGARPAGVAIDPTQSSVIYVSVTAYDRGGVYRSTDRGATWTRTGLREPSRTLLFAPREDSPLFALTNSGLEASANRGQTWRRLAPGIQAPSHLAIDPADPSHLYLISGGSVFYSSDGGETVTPVPNETFGGFVGAIAVSGSSVVLAGSGGGVYRSEDEGRVWSASNLGISEVEIRSLAIDPTNPAIVFAGSPRGIYESRDGGNSWIGPVPGSPEAKILAIDPADRSTMYAAGSGGVNKSTDGGLTWGRKLADQIADLVIDPSNPRRILAGYRNVHRSLDGAESWNTTLTPEDDYVAYYYPPRIEALAVAPSDRARVYAGGGGDSAIFYRSDDGGDSWSGQASAPYWTDALAVDSCDPRVVHAATFLGVARSTDAGETWTTSQFSWVRVLARDPRHSSSVFAGTSQGLFWSNDHGVTWAPFQPALNEFVHSIAIDPSGRFIHVGTERGVFSLERTFDPCRDAADRLCLIGPKFQIRVTARDPRTGAHFAGRAIKEGDQFGYFSFPDVTGDPDFPEVFVKMVDARGAPPPYGGYAWVFHSSLTNLSYTLTVLDTETGRIRTYEAVGSPSLACGVADTSAFVRSCSAGESSETSGGSRLAAADGPNLSLLNSRFRATIRATDPRTGRTAEGAAIPRADGFGYFSFPAFTGDASFPEVFVKMVDGRAQPGSSFWVFHTGLTDLAYTLTVTDTVTGAVRTYDQGANAGKSLCGSADTTAFSD